MQKLSLRLPKYFSFTLLSTLLIAATLLTPSLHANINNIKGTYDILKPEYKQFSVIHGAVAWETGTIRRMYDLGTLGKKTSQIESKTIQLVHQLFYRIPESTSPVDFVVTEKIKSLSDIDTTLFVADCMLYLTNLPETEFFKNYQKYFAEYLTKDEGKKPSFKKKFLIPERLKIEASIKKDPIFAKYDQALRNLLPFIANAALECSIENYLPDYTPQLIVLGLLYKKTNCNRDMLEAYYKHLQDNIDCLNSPADWNAWKENVFTTQEDFKITNELQTAPPTDETIHNLYEKYIFATLTPDNHPPIISYSKPGIDPLVNCKEKGNEKNYRCFSDCMDTTIRNLINFLCYNSQTKLFDVTLLESRLGNPIHKSLKDFYIKNPDPNKAGDDPAHNDWAQTVISNIPFVIYRRTLPQPTSTFTDPRFIKIENPSASLAEFLKQNSIELLTEKAPAYEIVTSLKTLIIVLNHLLGIKLFIGANGDITEEEFLNEHFIKTYLPKIITAFRTSLPYDFSLEDIDKRDYTDKQIRLPLNLTFEQPEFYSINLTIGTKRGHGEIIFTPDQEKTAIQPQLSLPSKAPISYILTMENPTNFSNTQTCFLWLFSQPLDNPDRAFDVLKKNILFDKNILNLFIFVAGKNADIDRKTDIMLKIYKAALEKGLAEDKFVVKEAFNLAKKDVLSGFASFTAREIFEILVSKDKEFDEVIDLARTQFGIEDIEAKIISLELFKSLALKGKFLDEAARAAKNSMTYFDDFQLLLLELFEILASKDKLLDEAANIATRGINLRRTEEQEAVFKLFEILADKGVSLDAAITIARDGLASSDYTIQNNAGRLLSLLGPKNKYRDHVIDAIKMGLPSAHIGIKESAEEFLKELEAQKTAMPAAVTP